MRIVSRYSFRARPISTPAAGQFIGSAMPERSKLPADSCALVLDAIPFDVDPDMALFRLTGIGKSL